MTTFNIYRAPRQEWRWVLVDDRATVIAASGEGYASKEGARAGVERMRQASVLAPVVDLTPVDLMAALKDSLKSAREAREADQGDVPMTDLNDIVRTRYETGAYGNAHLRLSEATWLTLRATHPVQPKPVWREPLADLLSIPIVFDETLPSGDWRLVDTTTDEVLHSGRVSNVDA